MIYTFTEDGQNYLIEVIPLPFSWKALGRSRKSHPENAQFWMTFKLRTPVSLLFEQPVWLSFVIRHNTTIIKSSGVILLHVSAHRAIIWQYPLITISQITELH
jgi:hypothetical protein